MSDPVFNSHCSYCGSRFAEQEKYPRTCFICNHDTYRNPTPVVVAILRVEGRTGQPYGWLVEQRNIEPEKGGWAFPGGYLEYGETWQQGIVRELQEEIGLTTDPNKFELLEAVNSAANNLILFAAYQDIIQTIEFVPNSEVSDVRIAINEEELGLCFPTHFAAWKRYVAK